MDPFTGGTTAILHTVAMHYAGIAQLFYNPPKGIVNTVTSVPQGIAGIILDVHEGFDSIPRQIGSNVRERGPVDDLQSGFVEGGKGLFYGWWDGITGLVTEPLEGGRKEGALGVIKGMGRSYVNVTARPAAGILGAMALPIHGISKSLRRKMAGSPQNTLHEPRMELSREAASQASDEEKERILGAFDEAVKGAGERKRKLRKQAERLMDGDEGVLEDSLPSTVLETPSDMTGGISVDGTRNEGDKSREEDVKKREMEEAERRGYERAMAELQVAREKDQGSKGF